MWLGWAGWCKRCWSWWIWWTFDDLKIICPPGDIDSAHYDCSISANSLLADSCDMLRNKRQVNTIVTSITSTGTSIITTTSTSSKVCFACDIGWCCGDLTFLLPPIGATGRTGFCWGGTWAKLHVLCDIFVWLVLQSSSTVRILWLMWFKCGFLWDLPETFSNTGPAICHKQRQKSWLKPSTKHI